MSGRGSRTKIFKKKNKLNFSNSHRFGDLKVIREITPQISPQGKKLRRFYLVCECGIEKSVLLMHLRSGKIRSCGCLKQAGHDKTKAGNTLISGQTYGRWKVLEEDLSKNTKPLGRWFKCLCSCGTKRSVTRISLISGNSLSCGCLRLEKLKTGAKPKEETPLGRHFGYWTILRDAPDKIYLKLPHIFRTRMVLARCDCGKEQVVGLQWLKEGTSKSCGCSTDSQQEKDLFNFVRSIHPHAISQDRTILDTKELDILLPEVKLAFEYNGNYWHSEKFRDKHDHFKKREEASEKGYHLIQIRSDEWLFKQDIVKSILKSKLGLSSNKHFARNLKVKEVQSVLAQKFLNENHLMGGFKAGRHIGLFTNKNQLVQLFSYKLLNSKTEMDCSRICSLSDSSVVGGVSKLLNHATKKHSSVKKVISFVDLRYADGHSLLKIGFNQVGITLGWRWTDGKNTYNRLKCRANMDTRGLTEKQHAEELKWFKIYDAGQAKFEKSLL